MKILTKHLEQAFQLTTDLIHSAPDEILKMKLSDLPSNSIGEQIWCIIGARESYLKAIMSKKWSGFSCTLKDTTSKSEVIECLQNSAGNCLKFLNSQNLDESQTDLLINLFEHEIQHHGQLIRYFYGNRIPFPKSWNDRYTV